MARIAAAFPNSKPDKMTMQIYFELLHHVPSDELKKAVDTCISEPGRAFPPTIGEILEEWERIKESRPLIGLPMLSEGPPLVYVPMPDYVRERLGKLVKSKEIKHARNGKMGRTAR